MNSFAAHVTDSEYHRDGRPSDLPADEFPNTIRIFADESNYKGFDAEFDIGVRALVDGIFALHERGELHA